MQKESNSRKVFKSMHSQTLITVIMGLLEVIYFSIMSRLLSQKVFGLFALITAVTSILTSLSDAGLGASIIQRKDADYKFQSTAYTLSILTGLFFGLILFTFAPYFSLLMVENKSLTIAFRIMSIMMLLQGINNVHNALLIRELVFFKLGIYKAVAYFLSSILGIILAIKDFGVYAIVCAVVTNQFIFTLIMFWKFRHNRLSLIIKKKYVKAILGFGGWLTTTVMLRNITNQVDKFIVARMLSVTDVGTLNRPNGFINTISTKVNSIFDTILFPILSSIQHNLAAIKSAFEKAISLIIVFSSFLSGTVVLGSKYIIDIFFGSEWENIQELLWLFGFGLIFSGLSRIEDCFFRSLGKMRTYFYARLINCFIAIGLIIIGCKFGLLGVASAMLIIDIISVIVKYFMLKQYIKIKNIEFLKAITENVWFSLILEIILFIILLNWASCDMYIVFIYLTIIISTIIIYPKLYGELFYNQIYKRYVYPLIIKLHNLKLN